MGLSNLTLFINGVYRNQYNNKITEISIFIFSKNAQPHYNKQP
jgi:hypothetical protein